MIISSLFWSILCFTPLLHLILKWLLRETIVLIFLCFFKYYGPKLHGLHIGIKKHLLLWKCLENKASFATSLCLSSLNSLPFEICYTWQWRVWGCVWQSGHWAVRVGSSWRASLTQRVDPKTADGIVSAVWWSSVWVNPLRLCQTFNAVRFKRFPQRRRSANAFQTFRGQRSNQQLKRFIVFNKDDSSFELSSVSCKDHWFEQRWIKTSQTDLITQSHARVCRIRPHSRTGEQTCQV